MAPNPAETWTTRRLLAWMSETFTKKGLDSPRLSAELLLSHVIGCERLRLYMDVDRPASPLEREQLRTLVARALAHEPIQYLVGEAWFFGLPLHVDKRVLVPRPETETIVEQMIQYARTEPGFGGTSGEGLLIADICTGSGCIAVALAKNLSGARIVAADVSADALEVARRNAVRHGVAERIDFLQGDLLAPLDEHPAARGKGSLHGLVANPPYIPDREWADVPPNVKEHEPEGALRGGPDGLKFVRPLIEHGPSHLRPEGLLLVEIAEATASSVLELARSRAELADAEVLKDVFGRPRVLRARRRRA